MQVFLISDYLVESEYITRYTYEKIVLPEYVVIKIYGNTEPTFYTPDKKDSVEAEREIQGSFLTFELHIHYAEIIVYGNICRILESLTKMWDIYIA